MTPIYATASPETSNIFTLTVRDGVTGLNDMADNTHRKNINSLIANVEACLISMKQNASPKPIVEIPHTLQLQAAEFEKHAVRLFSQTALQSIRGVLSGETVVFDAALNDMASLQYEISQLCLNVQQSRLKSNSESLHKLNLKNIEKMQEAIDQAAKSKAAQEKMGFWGKLSNILGVVAAAAGILLAPFTGGLSLLATGYLVVDLGLQIGEQASGIKMSIESGLQKGIKALLMLLPEGTLSEEKCEMIAGIVSSIVCMIVAIGMSVVSVGAGAPKIFSAFSKLAKFVKSASKVSKAAEISKAAKAAETVTKTEKLKAVAPLITMTTEGVVHASVAVTGAIGGAYGLQNASSEYALNGIEVQRTELNKQKELLLEAFEQCKDDTQKISEGMQRMLSEIGEMLSTYYDSSVRIIESMSSVRHAA